MTCAQTMERLSLEQAGFCNRLQTVWWVWGSLDSGLQSVLPLAPRMVPKISWSCGTRRFVIICPLLSFTEISGTVLDQAPAVLHCKVKYIKFRCWAILNRKNFLSVPSLLPKPFLLVPKIPPIKEIAGFSWNEPKGHPAHLWNPSPGLSRELVRLKCLNSSLLRRNHRPVETQPSFLDAVLLRVLISQRVRLPTLRMALPTGRGLSDWIPGKGDVCLWMLPCSKNRFSVHWDLPLAPWKPS